MTAEIRIGPMPAMQFGSKQLAMGDLAVCSEHGVIGAGHPTQVAFAAIGHGTVAHPRLGAGP